MRLRNPSACSAAPSFAAGAAVAAAAAAAAAATAKHSRVARLVLDRAAVALGIASAAVPSAPQPCLLQRTFAATSVAAPSAVPTATRTANPLVSAPHAATAAACGSRSSSGNSSTTTGSSRDPLGRWHPQSTQPPLPPSDVASLSSGPCCTLASAGAVHVPVSVSVCACVSVSVAGHAVHRQQSGAHEGCSELLGRALGRNLSTLSVLQQLQELRQQQQELRQQQQQQQRHWQQRHLPEVSSELPCHQRKLDRGWVEEGGGGGRGGHPVAPPPTHLHSDAVTTQSVAMGGHRLCFCRARGRLPPSFWIHHLPLRHSSSSSGRGSHKDGHRREGEDVEIERQGLPGKSAVDDCESGNNVARKGGGEYDEEGAQSLPAPSSSGGGLTEEVRTELRDRRHRRSQQGAATDWSGEGTSSNRGGATEEGEQQQQEEDEDEEDDEASSVSRRQMQQALADALLGGWGDAASGDSDVLRRMMQQKEQQRFLRVALVGAPNAGKSMLTNRLVGMKISAVSRKTNTTKKEIMGISTQGNLQMVFHDTPGLTQEIASRPLSPQARTASRQAVSVMERCQVVALVVDAHRQINRVDPRVVRLAERIGSEQREEQHRILVLNKVDLLDDKRLLLPLADSFSHLHAFERTFMVSALKDRGVKDLRTYLQEQAVEASWEEDPERRTDQSVEELALQMVREALLDRLHQELPYSVQQQHVETQQLADGSLRVEQRLWVETVNQRGILLGTDGANIRRIGMHARKLVEDVVGQKVHLILNVKVNRRRLL